MLANKTVITDASCFILLQNIDALFVLEALFGQVVTTPDIASEYGMELPTWVNVMSPSNTSLLNTYAGIVDRGEASAMVLAGEINADLLIIDDAQTRKFAKQLDLQITGSVGILLMAKQQSIISELRPYLNKVQQTNFRISDRLVNEIIIAAGE